jgi:hypothetical protein
MTKQKKVTVTMPEELAAKIKAYAAFQNTSMRLFIISTLMQRVRLIEKGEDKTIKIINRER